MQTYLKAVEELTDLSLFVVQVLLGGDDSIELFPTTRALPSLEEFARRRLRPVAVLGLRGCSQTACVFKEELPEHILASIGMAYGTYIDQLLGPDYADQIARAEVEALERLYALPDTRLN